MNMVTLEVGQVWESLDRRDNGRRVVVEEIESWGHYGTKAVCRNLATGKRTRIHSMTFEDATKWRRVEATNKELNRGE